jgi:hypothetical protein
MRGATHALAASTLGVMICRGIVKKFVPWTGPERHPSQTNDACHFFRLFYGLGSTVAIAAVSAFGEDRGTKAVPGLSSSGADRS